MSNKMSPKKCLIIVAVSIFSTGSSAKASFTSGVPVNLGVTLAAASLAQVGVWTERTPMPTGRLGVSCSVVNGKIYAIGGYAAANSPGMRTVEEYDPATDSWITKAPMPTGRRWFSTSVVNGKIYALGGYTNYGQPGLSAVEEYDPATDTWTRKAPMPTARLALATSAVDGIIYAIGGSSLWPQLLSTVEAYDPLTDTWTTKADIPTARAFFSASAAYGKIYAIGSGSGGPSVPVLATVEEYNPATDTWTTKAPMPAPRGALTTSTVDGKIYAVAGAAPTGGAPLSKVEAYDPLTDTWTRKTDMPGPRVGVGTGVVYGKLYAIGGAATSGGGHPGTRTVFEYDPDPLVIDFNGDGIVDSADISLMVEHWHTDEPFYDIAPRPFGDGIVDLQDLVMLSEHLFEEILPSGLVAYWKLDETEGEMAYDSAGQNDAFVIGGPLWLPDGGQASGAIQLDGVDDVLIAAAPLNPADGPLSVFVWVNGGAPGQAIISEPAGPDWLSLDPMTGHLMTELTTNGRSAAFLLSETVIADGNWHRIGFIWDGLYRTLYVDGVAVAEDVQNRLASPANGFYIGTGKAMAPGTYLFGLIDDVRIYSRALNADEIAAMAR